MEYYKILNQNKIKELNINGFLLIKNCIDLNNVKYAQSCINNKVNYKKLEPYFDDVMLKTIKNELKIDLECTKYRVSNNTNSADAGVFHRDLQSYGKNNEEIPVFTCLSYLDKTHMELIPGSHKYTHLSLYQIPFIIKNRTIVTVNPGDLLIFYATILHRGIFYEQTPQRRLIQLFDCIPKVYVTEFKKSILHIPCEDNCNSNISSFFIALHKIPICSEYVNYVGFCTAAKGYGSYYNCLKYITNDKEIKYLSTESNRGRIVPKGGFEEQNMYVVYTNDIKDIDSAKHGKYVLFTFLLDIIIYFILLLILIYLIVKVLRYYFSSSNRKINRKRK